MTLKKPGDYLNPAWNAVGMPFRGQVLKENLSRIRHTYNVCFLLLVHGLFSGSGSGFRISCFVTFWNALARRSMYVRLLHILGNLGLLLLN